MSLDSFRGESGFSTSAELLSELRIVPEVRALRNVSENNRFHGGRGEITVRDHTHRVISATQAMINGTLDVFSGDPGLFGAMRGFFTADAGFGYTNGDIQTALAIVHDIGKGMPGGLTENADGTTGSVGHEDLSAQAMPTMFKTLREEQGILIPGDIQTLLTFLVRHHGDAYLGLMADNPSAGPIETAVEARFEIRRVYDPRHKVAILVNVVADMEAGRVEAGPYEGQEFGFSKRNKQDARQLLRRYFYMLA